VIANQGSSPTNAVQEIDPNDGSLLVRQLDKIVRITFPTGPATSFTIDAPTSLVAGKPFAATVTARDTDGHVVTGYTGTITFSSSDPYPALLPSDYAFPPADRGQHAFGLLLFTAGPQTLTVQDTANRSITGNATIAVHAESARHLLMTGPPTAVAGSPLDVTLAALDPYGNVDPNYHGTVTFASGEPAARVILPPAYTFTNGDAGMRTFSEGATLLRAGSQTITATDTANGSLLTGGELAGINSGGQLQYATFGMSPKEALSIDTKLDDGWPQTGSVIARNTSFSNGAPPGPDPGHNSAGWCVLNTTTPYTYMTTLSPDANTACTISIRF
jgi:hypothetical protein